MLSSILVWAADSRLGLLLARDLDARGEPLLVLSPTDGTFRPPENHGSRCRFAAVEPEDPNSFIRPIADVVDEWGQPHGLALLLPAPPARPFHELTVGEWQGSVAAALLAVVLLLRAALPAAALETAGRVVTVLPAQPDPPPHRRGGRCAGDALRGALNGLVRALANEPAGRHARWFRVQAAAPGEGYDLDQAALAARGDGPDATAGLVGWLLTAPAARLPRSDEIAARAARG
jgi:NAD(P)-dependent dehydrogenase (short-subunit alcohol dehydrogenase family)